MYFQLQVSQPFVHLVPDEERQDLSSAMLAVFPETSEDAILLWNWIPIRINYNCDLSVMMEDLLWMLSELLESDRGTSKTFFGANTFRTEWSLRWAEGNLRIDARWESVAGSYEDLLNSRNILEIKKDKFLKEWKALLGKVIDAIRTSGIKITDKESVELLHRVEAAIRGFGQLYNVNKKFQ